MSDLTDFFDDEVSENLDKYLHLHEREWVGMPEFTQESKKPYALINVRFENEEDLQEFATLIGQPLTVRTKSIWHPQLDRHKNSGLQWEDEDES